MTKIYTVESPYSIETDLDFISRAITNEAIRRGWISPIHRIIFRELEHDEDTEQIMLEGDLERMIAQ